MKKRRAVEIVEPNRTVTAEDYMPTSEKADEVEEIVLRARQGLERHILAAADDCTGFSVQVEVSVELNLKDGRVSGKPVVWCGISASSY